MNLYLNSHRYWGGGLLSLESKGCHQSHGTHTASSFIQQYHPNRVQVEDSHFIQQHHSNRVQDEVLVVG